MFTRQTQACAAAARVDGAECAAVFDARAAAEEESLSETLLEVGKEAVIGARRRHAGQVAALILIPISEDDSAAAMRERALIAGRLSLGDVERAVRPEVRIGLNQSEARRNHGG